MVDMHGWQYHHAVNPRTMVLAMEHAPELVRTLQGEQRALDASIVQTLLEAAKELLCAHRTVDATGKATDRWHIPESPRSLSNRMGDVIDAGAVAFAEVCEQRDDLAEQLTVLRRKVANDVL